jgi:BASS family bile acid:Na+ symporter
MNAAELIKIAIAVSMFLVVFAVGLTATLRDAASLFRQPGQLARVVVAMYVVMLAVVIGVALAFDLHPAVKITLGALAVSPVPPILTGKALKAGGDSSYTTGMMVAASLLCIVFLPLAMWVCEQVFATQLALPIPQALRQVATSVLVPLAAGMLLRHFFPSLADQAKRISLLAMVLLALAFAAVLAGAWSSMGSLIGGGTLLALLVFVLVGLASGHLLGGPLPEERAVLAVACASRHPGLAIAIAQANFPDEKLVAPAVLLYLVVMVVVTSVYAKWSGGRVHRIGRRHA